KLTSAPALTGELLDGLWLPRPLRLSSWVSIPLVLAFVIVMPLFWAPLSARDQERERFKELERIQAETAQNTPVAPDTVEEIGNPRADGAIARRAVSDMDRAPPQSRFVPRTVNDPPPERGMPPVGPNPTDGKPPIYVDPPENWPGTGPRAGPGDGDS